MLLSPNTKIYKILRFKWDNYISKLIKEKYVCRSFVCLSGFVLNIGSESSKLISMLNGYLLKSSIDK